MWGFIKKKSAPCLAPDRSYNPLIRLFWNGTMYPYFRSICSQTMKSAMRTLVIFHVMINQELFLWCWKKKKDTVPCIDVLWTMYRSQRSLTDRLLPTKKYKRNLSFLDVPSCTSLLFESNDFHPSWPLHELIGMSVATTLFEQLPSRTEPSFRGFETFFYYKPGRSILKVTWTKIAVHLIN